MRKRKMRLLPATEAVPQRTSKQLQNFIGFERFQIGLPPGKFGIIVHANWHYPVVPANTQKSETPP